MQPKLDKMQTLLDSGFEIDEITSDDTLDIALASGETRITIRFDRDEVAELWPRLFGDEVPVRPRRVLAATPQPTPYGLADVVHLWKRDEHARG